MSKSYPTPAPPPPHSSNPTEQAEQTRIRREYFAALTPLQAAELQADEAEDRARTDRARADALQKQLDTAREQIKEQDEELTELREAQDQHESSARTNLAALTRAIADASTPEAITHAASQIAGAIATEAIAPPAGRSLLYALQIALSAAKTKTKTPGQPAARKKSAARRRAAAK